MKKRTGRPKKAAKDRRSEILSVRFTREELAKIEEKARGNKLDARDWVRVALLQVA